ncbi:MAG: hypothetical protein WCD04_17740 [Terriglobia bacterium]
MSHQDWVAFAKIIVFAPALFLATLYYLEYKGSLENAHAAIWKKPKPWQLVTLCALWGLIIVGLVLLLCIHDSS